METMERQGAKIERGLRNFAATIRRAETAGAGRNWAAQEANARGHFAALMAAVVAIEDTHGIDAGAKYADKLTALRQRATACGLLTVEDVSRIEFEAVAA